MDTTPSARYTIRETVDSACRSEVDAVVLVEANKQKCFHLVHNGTSSRNLEYPSPANQLFVSHIMISNLLILMKDRKSEVFDKLKSHHFFSGNKGVLYT